MKPFPAALACLCLACADPAVVSDAGSLPDAPMRDAGTDAGPPAALDDFVLWQMERGHLPGLAAAVIRDGEVAWVGTYGYADVEMQTPIDAHSLFIVASVSKTIAVALALQLVEMGTLDLDAPVDSILSVPVRHPDFPADAITTRMFLCHVSGIVDNFLALASATGAGDPTETLDEFTRSYLVEGGSRYSDTNFGMRPGTDRDYCNAGYGVAGDVIEIAGGASFREQAEARVFGPLAMDGAGFFLSDVDPTHLAVPYAWNGRRYNPQTIEGYVFYPASSLRVSITGLARYMRMWLGEGVLDGVRVLAADSVQRALQPQFPAASQSQALTFYQHRVGGRVYLGHSGETFGGSAQFLFSPSENRGLVLLTNSDAYVRQDFGFPEGAESMDDILLRLDNETF